MMFTVYWTNSILSFTLWLILQTANKFKFIWKTKSTKRENKSSQNHNIKLCGYIIYTYVLKRTEDLMTKNEIFQVGNKGNKAYAGSFWEAPGSRFERISCQRIQEKGTGEVLTLIEIIYSFSKANWKLFQSNFRSIRTLSQEYA